MFGHAFFLSMVFLRLYLPPFVLFCVDDLVMNPPPPTLCFLLRKLSKDPRFHRNVGLVIFFDPRESEVSFLVNSYQASLKPRLPLFPFSFYIFSLLWGPPVTIFFSKLFIFAKGQILPLFGSFALYLYFLKGSSTKSLFLMNKVFL